MSEFLVGISILFPAAQDRRRCDGSAPRSRTRVGKLDRPEAQTEKVRFIIEMEATTDGTQFANDGPTTRTATLRKWVVACGNELTTEFQGFL
jgi:hypothetical protein